MKSPSRNRWVAADVSLRITGLAEKTSASTGVVGCQTLPSLVAGLCLAASLLTRAAVPENPREVAKAQVAEEYPTLFALYQHLHANPELSLHEEKTAARIAEELRRAGCEVTEKVGGHGVVGVLRNGTGPTLLLRTDLDALPVTEKTGLPYASKARTTDERGSEVDVMHACGHDAHMKVLVGTARVLTRVFKNWLGESQVLEVKPTMGGEDFGLYGQTADHIPITLFWLGISDPAAVTESEKSGPPLPSAHSSLFAPIPEPTLKTGVTAMTAAALELLKPQ